MKKLLLLFTFILLMPKFSYAGVVGSLEQDTFTAIGEKTQSSYKTITNAINKEVNRLAKVTGKWISTFLGSVYSVWFIYNIIKIVIHRESFLPIVKSLFVVSIVLGLVYNLNLLNTYLQKPLIETYNLFGGALLSSGNSTNTIITEIANNLSKPFEALNNSSGNLLSNFGSVILSLVIMFFLFLVFVQIFLILLRNYLKIMLPFAFSPIFLCCFVFVSTRQVAIKAINIVIDGILKQGFILITINIMSNVFYSSLKSINQDVSISAITTVLIIAIVYREFISTAESLSSELIGTQAIGTSSFERGIATAGAVSLGMGIFSAGKSLVSSYQNPDSKMGAIMRYAVSGSGKFSTGLVRGGINAWKKSDEIGSNTSSELAKKDETSIL